MSERRGVPCPHLSLQPITMTLLSKSTSLQETPDNPAELEVKSFVPKLDIILDIHIRYEKVAQKQCRKPTSIQNNEQNRKKTLDMPGEV